MLNDKLMVQLIQGYRYNKKWVMSVIDYKFYLSFSLNTGAKSRIEITEKEYHYLGSLKYKEPRLSTKIKGKRY